MPRFEATQLTAAYRQRCEDRVIVIQQDERTVIVVADGAGGIGNGEAAAERVIEEVRAHYLPIESAADWESQLAQIDCRIGVGEATAVVVDLRADSIIGASVGDSVAWLMNDGELIDLTKDQVRKPLLGSGNAQPRGFTNAALQGILLVATDGFANYVKRDRVAREIASCDFFEIGRHLLNSVRLPSGELWDDVGLVVCRGTRSPRTRRRYEIE
jgi:serine/threonine protein phosphatase PrpC